MPHRDPIVIDQFNFSAWLGHTISGAAIVGTLMGYLPAIAAGAALIWYLIQIWESKTIQTWWRTKMMKRKARKLVKLRAKSKVVQAEIEALELVRQARADARDRVATAAVEAIRDTAKEEISIVARDGIPEKKAD